MQCVNAQLNEKSKISSDFRAVFYSFSFRDNFYLENHNIRRTACFWHDEKNNSDERDTRLKRLSVTEIIVVFLQSRSSIYIFTD